MTRRTTAGDHAPRATVLAFTLGAVCALAPNLAFAQAPVGAPLGEPATVPVSGSGQGGHAPYIQLDVPRRIDPKKPFDMDVWVKGSDAPTTTLYMEEGTDVAYSPKKVVVRRGERGTVRCELRNTAPRSGLVQVTVSADCCDDRSATLDAGFRLSARPIGLDGNLVAGEQRMVAFELVDEQGRQTPLDGPLQMMVLASQAHLQDGPHSLRETTFKKLVDRGGAVTPFFWVNTDQRWLGVPRQGVASLALELRNDHGDILLRQPFTFPIRPRWWAQLVAATAGSLLWFAFSTAANPARRDVRALSAALVLALASGVMAYVLVATKLVGLNVDTSGMLGFVVLGVLLHGSGAEAVLRAVAPKLGLPARAATTSPAAL